MEWSFYKNKIWVQSRQPFIIPMIFQITIQDISAKTSMHPQDIALTMMLLSFVRKNHNNKFILAIDWPRVDQHMQRVAASLANKTR